MASSRRKFKPWAAIGVGRKAHLLVAVHHDDGVTLDGVVENGAWGVRYVRADRTVHTSEGVVLFEGDLLWAGDWPDGVQRRDGHAINHNDALNFINAKLVLETSDGA